MEKPAGKPRVRLEDWEYIHHTRTRNWLTGRVFDHLHLEDGEEIDTSRILRFNEDRTKAETSNTIYVLGRRKAPDAGSQN